MAAIFAEKTYLCKNQPIEKPIFMPKPTGNLNAKEMLCYIVSVMLTFFFSSGLCFGNPRHNEADSFAVYDRALSFQSRISLDSQIAISKQAENYAIRKENVYKRYFYAVRRGFLYFSLDSNKYCEQINQKVIPDLERIMDEHPSPQWKSLLVESYSNLALSLVYGEKTDSALRIYQHLYSRFEQDSNASLRAKCLNGIGATFAYRSYIDIALKYFKHALQEYEDARDQRGIYLACSNIGTAYLDKQMYKEALPYCTRSYQIVEAENYQGTEAITSRLAMGYIYAGLGQFNIANQYFSEALERTRQGNYYHLEGFVTMAYAKSLLQEGKHAQCLRLASEQLKRLDGEKKFSLQADLLKLLSQCHEEMGNEKEALGCLRQAMTMVDSSFAAEQSQSLLQLELEYNNYRHEQEHLANQNDLVLTRLKAQNRMLWIFGLSGISAILALLIIFLIRHFSKVQKQSEQIKADSEKKLQKAGETIEQKNKELAANTLRFLRLNHLQNAILENLKTLKTAFTLRGKEKSIVCEIENLAKQIASEKEWKDFEFYFEQVDKGFLAKLSKVCPDLTSNEKHLCVLFNLGLSNRDVANLTGRTLQSIGMAKFRLKNKLKLENSEDIVAFLQSLDYPMPQSPIPNDSKMAEAASPRERIGMDE